ncbi:MAG: helix-turn-helix domain-containing protein [Firmicutes bacterium]|nr:helix-turn-helix domain-containing protein [Bacillota bacterium]
MDEKEKALRDCHAFNPRPEAVKDELFRTGGKFFDPRDLVQVKYEMLRRVQRDGVPVSRAARDFGFSRPSFYQTKADFAARGLPGLIPEKPGPRGAHKLTGEVMAVIDEWLLEKPPPRAKELAGRLRQQFGIEVHPRSIERSLQRRTKKGHPK